MGGNVSGTYTGNVPQANQSTSSVNTRKAQNKEPKYSIFSKYDKNTNGTVSAKEQRNLVEGFICHQFGGDAVKMNETLSFLQKFAQGFKNIFIGEKTKTQIDDIDNQIKGQAADIANEYTAMIKAGQKRDNNHKNEYKVGAYETYVNQEGVRIAKINTDENGGYKEIALNPTITVTTDELLLADNQSATPPEEQLPE